MDIEKKKDVYQEFKRSKESAGAFARKRGIADSTMRRLVKEMESGKFDSKVVNNKRKRLRVSPFDAVEQKIVDYIQFRVMMYKNGHEKCGLSYRVLQIKSLNWAQSLLSQRDMAVFKAPKC